MARAVDDFGWSSLIALRIGLSILLLLLLARTLIHGASARASVPVFVATVMAVGGYLQERPQMVSFVLLVPAAGLVDAAVRAAALPRKRALIASLATVALWANFHGLWVLVPAFMCTAAVGGLLDKERDVHLALRWVAFAGALALAGCLSPLGPGALVLPLRFRGSTEHIAEWSRTEIWSPYALGLLLLLGLIVVAWTRSPWHVPRSEIAFVFLVVVFAGLAVRNVPPAAILLAPLARRLRMRIHPVDSATSPRERQFLATACIAGLIAAAGYVGFVSVHQDPLGDAEPLALARQLQSIPRDPDGKLRVLDAYNSSGVLVTFGGPGVQLAVDGRADRYGGAYLDRYLKAMALQGDWAELLEELRPDVAVLEKDSQLAFELTGHEGWSNAGSDGDYVLLLPPSPTLP